MTWIAAGTAATGLVSSYIGSRSASRASRQQQAAAEAARRQQAELYGRTAETFEPYTRVGSRASNLLLAGLGNGTDGDLTRRFSLADFEKEPGYDFRMQEGQRGVEGSAAARGNVLSGAAQKALMKYGQNFASNEYGKAYDRYSADQDNRFQRIFGTAGLGLNATNNLATATTNFGNQSSGLITGSGNAQAAGSIGTGNALNDGLGTATGAWQYYMANRPRSYTGGNIPAGYRSPASMAEPEGNR
jgi:hypothetical protein